MATFLLDEHLGRRDIAVDKAGVAEFDLPLEGNEVADVLLGIAALRYLVGSCSWWENMLWMQR